MSESKGFYTRLSADGTETLYCFEVSFPSEDEEADKVLRELADTLNRLEGVVANALPGCFQLDYSPRPYAISSQDQE